METAFCQLALRVQPGARSDELSGWIIAADGRSALKVRLRARAVDGQANEALRTFLAEAFGLRPRQVTLLQGERSRDKLARLEGLTREEVSARVAKLGGEPEGA